jgi:hypothetical protein
MTCLPLNDFSSHSPNSFRHNLSSGQPGLELYHHLLLHPAAEVSVRVHRECDAAVTEP